MSLVSKLLEELRATPMLELCTKCDGSGEVQSAAWAEFLSKFTVEDLTRTDQVADKMHVQHPSASALMRAGVAEDLAVAYTSLYGEPDVVPCETCNGTRTAVTAFGHQVAELYGELRAALAAVNQRSPD